MNQPNGLSFIEIVLMIIKYTAFCWIVVGIFVFLVKWAHWDQDGSWLAYLPVMIIIGIVGLVAAACIVAGIIGFIREAFKNEKMKKNNSLKS